MNRNFNRGGGREEGLHGRRFCADWGRKEKGKAAARKRRRLTGYRKKKRMPKEKKGRKKEGRPKAYSNTS